MKNSLKITIGILLFFTVLWACTTKQAATAALGGNGLPPNPAATCTVAQDTFNSWFVSGKPTENGAVTPANSLAFPHKNNCDFYQWSEHMFMWITSPATGLYSGHKSVLESGAFYNVSPENANGQRTLTAHDSIHPLRFTAHVVKNGADRLPVIVSKSGKLFEVEVAQRNGKILQAVKGADGKIAPAGVLTIEHKANAKNIVKEFMVGKTPVFFDSNGKQVQTEAGQATGDALIDQHGSLVYYLSLVNDVYAWFLTASKNGYMSGSEFPTTAADRDSICAYARMNHATLPDSNALAIEIKSSWVEASTLKDAQNYFCVMATIPTYDTTSKVKWIPTGEKTVKMAMVGVHIVGSLAHHPEMAWATFERMHITPNAKYTYVDSNNQVDTVQQDTGSDWLFSSNAADTTPNVSYITNVDTSVHPNITSDTLFSNNGHNIGPSNTLMINPWGSAMGSPTNAEDKSSAASNSEILSINNTIYADLVGNDIRKNYLLIGATWTNGGAPPTGVSYGVDGDTTAGVSIGTSVLANSTMETYIQLSSTSCFTCHHDHSTPSLNPDELSHIYGGLQQLPTTVNVTNKKKKK